MSPDVRVLPSPATLYRALCRRDPAFEGLFLYGVKTTGVFCRPTCRSRRPLERNVAYFAEAQEARAAGFRACKRCRPEQAPAPGALVARLMAEAQRAEEPLTSTALRALGVDPSTARRAFQREMGLSFAAYQRRLRLGQGLGELKARRPVIEAQQGQGYASGSGFRAAFARLFGKPPVRAGEAEALVLRRIATPLGPVVALATDAGLALVDYADGARLRARAERVARALGAAVVPGTNLHLERLAEQLGRYFAGEAVRFDLPAACPGSDFERRVWAELRRLGPGETATYAELARRVGRPGAARAVGRAVGANPLYLIVPCHRVVRADGTIGGYGGGAWRKRWLLKHELSSQAAQGTTRSSSAPASTRSPG